MNSSFLNCNFYCDVALAINGLSEPQSAPTGLEGGSLPTLLAGGTQDISRLGFRRKRRAIEAEGLAGGMKPRTFPIKHREV